MILGPNENVSPAPENSKPQEVQLVGRNGIYGTQADALLHSDLDPNRGSIPELVADLLRHQYYIDLVFMNDGTSGNGVGVIDLLVRNKNK